MPIPAIAAAAGAGAGAGSAAGTAAGIAGSIGAGASSFDALGGLGLGIASLIMQRRANAQMRADQRFYWEQNLPQNRMAQLRAAGLNPYGDFVNGQIAQPQPVNLAAGIDSSLGLMANSLSKGAQGAFNAIANRIAFKQLELEEKKLDNNTKITNAQARLLGNKDIYQQLLNYLTDQTMENSISLSHAEVEEALNRIIGQTIDNSWRNDEHYYGLEKLLADIDNTRASTKATKYDTNIYKPQSLDIARTAASDTHLISQEQLYNMQWDNAQLKYLDEIIDKIPTDDSKKTPLRGFLKGIRNVIYYYLQNR